MIRLYIIGLFILIIAIVANYIIGKLGIMSWYDFLNYLNNKENSGIQQVRPLNYLWLFIGYPLILALGYVLGEKVYELIFC